MLDFLLQNLAQNVIDLDTLLEMTEQDMTDLGFPFGVRKALLRVLK